MLQLTELAMSKLTEYLEQNNITTPVRVAAMNGCSGPSLGLALDEQKENDATIDRDNVKIVIDNDLLAMLGDVKVDFVEPTKSGCGCSGGGGFSITSTNPLPGSGGGCGNSCASGCGC